MNWHVAEDVGKVLICLIYELSKTMELEELLSLTRSTEKRAKDL